MLIIYSSRNFSLPFLRFPFLLSFPPPSPPLSLHLAEFLLSVFQDINGRFVFPLSFLEGTFLARGGNLSNEVGFKNTSPVPSSHSLFKANQKSFKQVKLDLKVLRSLSSGAVGGEVGKKFDGEILKFPLRSGRRTCSHCSCKSALSFDRGN